MTQAMDMKTLDDQDPSSVVTISDDEMQEVWVEEIVIEEDGSPVSPLYHHGETSPWNPRDVLVYDSGASSDGTTLCTEAAESLVPNSPSYIIPDSLTDEESELLDESFQLMEDLMSRKDVRWKHDMVLDDNTSQDDSFQLEDSTREDDSVVNRAQALLDELDQYTKQEPLNCDWLEEKTDLPLLDEIGGYFPARQTAVPYHPKYPTPVVGQIAPVDALTLLTSASQYQAHVPELSARTSLSQTSLQLSQVPDLSQVELSDVTAPLTPALIREFECVLHQTLTPPQTPPQYLDLVNTQEEVKENDLGEEELDALINSQVASLYDEKSRLSEFARPESQDSPPPSTEDSDSAVSESDPEWAPSPQTPRTSRQRNRRAVSSVEERKLRKKEQNKNAATRYRIKKKQEQEGIVGEESVLLDKNTELKEKATELQREVKYLKSLMRDICKAKGLL